MIDEDPFPRVASVNIAVTDLRVVLNEKKDERNPLKKIMFLQKRDIFF